MELTDMMLLSALTAVLLAGVDVPSTPPAAAAGGAAGDHSSLLARHPAPDGRCYTRSPVFLVPYRLEDPPPRSAMSFFADSPGEPASSFSRSSRFSRAER